jgi:hypothetical protein
MADIFLTNTAALAAYTTAVVNDVIYLTSNSEVYDVVNDKMKVTHNAVKVGTGVWAVLNRIKTGQYGSKKPGPWDKAFKYEAGTLINKDGKVFISNADVPANTNWVLGTTGATWKELQSSKILSTLGVPNVITEGFGGNCAVFSNDAFKAPINLYVEDFTFGLNSQPGASAVFGIFSFNMSTKRIVRSYFVPSPVINANASTTLSGGGLYVAAGEYVGMIASSTASSGSLVPYGMSPPAGGAMYYVDVATSNLISGYEGFTETAVSYVPAFSFRFSKA